MTFDFQAEVFFWKGPAPFYFVRVPENESREIKSAERFVTYGWGMIPASVRIGQTEWYTALWPKDGGYVVPLKVAIRRAERLEEGETIQVGLRVGTLADVQSQC